MADCAAPRVAGAENLISAGCHPSSLAGEFDSQLSASLQSYGGFVRLRGETVFAIAAEVIG